MNPKTIAALLTAAATLVTTVVDIIDKNKKG